MQTSVGLTPEQVTASRAAHGSNVLTPPRREPWWRQYLAKFDDPVIRILLIAAAIAMAVGAAEGHLVEGIGIIIAVLLATGLAFVNEFRAAREFDVLNKTSDDVPVTVRRAGNFTSVPRRDIVVGDIVQVEVGAEIPADGRLIEAVGLQVNESRLTGESRPVDKHVEPVHHGESAYAPEGLLRGTTIVDGYGLFTVDAVGDGTQIGLTARAAAEDSGTETPLNRQLERLSKWIGVVGFGVSIITFAALVARDVFAGALTLSVQQWGIVALLAFGLNVALIRVWLPIVFDAIALAGEDRDSPEWLEATGWRPWAAALGLGAGIVIIGGAIGQMVADWPANPIDWLPPAAVKTFLAYFMIAVTIIVVAVPEGLAMSVTLSLAYSMRKMTASNCLVRRLHACETIGAATVICSDKTGTLTMNEMRVAAAHFLQPIDVIAEAIAANSTAQLDRSGATLTPVGNPTEGALLLWLADAGKDYQAIRSAFATAEQWTFSTDRKFMATRGRSAILGQDVVYIKGAPEVVLERCDGVADVVTIRQQIAAYQTRGMRTLGIAMGKPSGAAELETLARGLTWLGFVAIADPVRPDVPGAIGTCRRAGIEVKVVTGDSPDTATEIARQIGLWTGDEPAAALCTGAKFEAMSDADAAQAATQLKILARARPGDKLRLVRLLQKQNQVVAVTGDGVNDAPALNYANVGLAMGKTGSAVAKEASDIILLDDSFVTIVQAVMWGRSLYQNIQRFVVFQLTINVAALALAFLGPFVGLQLPLTVMQMLWINLIMDTFAALALATEPPNQDNLKNPPRDPRAFVVTPQMARIIFGTASLFLLVLIGLILWLQQYDMLPSDNTPSRGASILFSVFVFLQFWNLFNARRLGSAATTWLGLTHNPAFTIIAVAIFVGQIVMVQFGGMAFRTVPLGWWDWVRIVVGTSPVFIVGELLRRAHRKPGSV